MSNILCGIEYNEYIMYNNKIVGVSRPFIFTKKIVDKSNIIPLNKEKNTLGPMRYFPPACQE
jgi:hypothetical protein